MMNEELNDRIKHALASADVHDKRMMSALKKLSSLFPITEDSYQEQTEDQVSYTDQLILRFLKLQDLLGQKLFPQILLSLEEDYSNRPFIDIINRLEQLGIIESAEKWIALREVRNLITHDYPHMIGELIDGLNLLFLKATELSGVYKKIGKFLSDRIH